ncbi:MAG: T9SS type A sorting domain-containing protein [Flavobacteriales bacterium]
MTKFYSLKTLALALILAITPFFSKAQIDLLQTTDNSIAPSLIVGCNAPGLGTRDNDFGRLYNLTDLGYSSFEVTKVTFGIQDFIPETSSDVEAVVKVYSSNGGTNAADLVLTGEIPVMLNPQMVGELVEVNFTNPVMVTSSHMMIVVSIPDLAQFGIQFFLGGNSNGQTTPGFLRSSFEDCGVQEFTSYADLAPNAHLVLFPTGNPTLICPPGDVHLASQAEVNQFAIDYPTCTHIDGALYIQVNDGTTDVTNLAPLNNLISIAGSLSLNNNQNLVEFNGLENLSSVGGNLAFHNNGMPSLSGLNPLQEIGGSIWISSNSQLQNLDALSSILQINGPIYISQNALLNNISGIENIEAASINTEVGVTITNNPALAVCNLPNICEYIANDPNTHYREINGNLSECLDEEAVIDACNGPTEGCTDAPYGLYPSETFTPSCTNSPEVITDQAWTGEYSLVNLQFNVEYTFSSTVATDYITITSEDGSVIWSYGVGSIQGVSAGDQTVRFYLHNNDQCESEQVQRSRIIQCGFVGVEEAVDFTFTCYPNPAKDQLNLSYNKKLDRVEVLNILGQVLMTQSVNAENAQMDISSLPSGNYVVKATSEGTVLTTKIVKQ